MRQLRVFLCHASQDKPAVRKLYSYLKQHGVQPWLDQEDLLPGQDWEVEIPKALFNSDVILVCISKNSVNKEGYVQKEIAFALDKAMEKPEGVIFIIPVKLEECDVPKRLSRYQWVDYYRVDGRKRLLLGLNVRAQGLGDEIIPVVMEDAKQRTPLAQPPKPEPKVEIQSSNHSLSTGKQPEQRFNQKKPYTKILNPNSLNPVPAQQRQPQQNNRWYALAGVALLLLILGGLGLNSLFNKSPEATSIPALQIFTETPKPPTETTVPLTPTLTESPSPSATPTTVLGIGSTSKSLKDGMVLVYIPAGDFTMGADDDGDDNKPAHQVYLDAFWIDQTEVTNTMYKACVDQNKCNPPDKENSATRLDYYGNDEYGNYPVIFVSWHDASSYCSWVGRRLPTEAEWEKAARGPNGNIYPWGNIDPKDTLLNYKGNNSDTTEVGSYPDGASLYGVLDLAGNVWEWVNDVYEPTYYQISPQTNPLGPNEGDYRVLRGGSWSLQNAEVESTYRYSFIPEVTNGVFGFRCALSKP